MDILPVRIIQVLSHHKERNYLDLPNGPSEHTKRGDEYFERYDPDGHLRNALTQSNIEVVELSEDEIIYG